jgi:hypothetical protein
VSICNSNPAADIKSVLPATYDRGLVATYHHIQIKYITFVDFQNSSFISKLALSLTQFVSKWIHQSSAPHHRPLPNQYGDQIGNAFTVALSYKTSDWSGDDLNMHTYSSVASIKLSTRCCTGFFIYDVCQQLANGEITYFSCFIYSLMRCQGTYALLRSGLHIRVQARWPYADTGGLK